jgi:ArsR family metal-binding transcriptional regulator
MMDISEIKKSLPDCRLSDIRPCTTPGTLQFHLLVDAEAPPMQKIIDFKRLVGLIPPEFEKKYSEELGVLKIKDGRAEISILASGRVVVKKAENEKEALKILKMLTPIIKKSLF